MFSQYFLSKRNILTFFITLLFTGISINNSTLAASGDLDPTFGNGGKIITPLDKASSDTAFAAALQTDGKIVAGGRTYNGSETKILVTRVNTDGSLDTNFGLNGVATKDLKNYLSNPRTDAFPVITAMTIQPDGKILTAGYISVFGGTISSEITFFARLNSDGSFDNSFGDQGVNVLGSYGRIHSMVVQPNGKIVSALDATIFFWALRLNSDGTIDTSFGADNNGILKIQTGLSARGFGITAQTDGKLVLSGRDTNGVVMVRLNADGSLDTTFDGDGKVFTQIPNLDVRAYSVSVQTDGKIVAVGNSVTGNGSETNGNVALVVRYNSDGSLDTTFDGDGILTNAIGTGINRIYSSQIQTDGKILIGGETSDTGGVYHFTVARLNSDGSFDNSFNSTGIVRLPVGTGNAYNRPVLLQTDGKIVLAGYGQFPDNSDVALIRLTTNGSLDSTFDDDGIANIELKNSDDYIAQIVIQTDGKIVTGLRIYAGIRNQFILKRYNANGTLDQTFGNNGTVITVFAEGSVFQNDLALQSDGKIIAIGGKFLNSDRSLIAVRYNPDGSVDSSFGINGIATAPNSWGTTGTIQSDGKILIGGYSVGLENGDFSVVRLNPNGSLDTTFGNTGMVMTPIGNSDDYVNDIQVQADGKIVAVGEVYFYFDLSNTPFDFGVVRYNADGSLDTTFDSDGIVTADIDNSSDGATLVDIQTDGKIVVGGYSDGSPIDNYKNVGLIRLNTDGSLDTSFDGDGKVSTQTGDHSEINDLKILSDGKIITAGCSLSANNGFDLTSIRYTSDGSLDSTYGSGGKSIIDINGNDDAIEAIAIQADGKMLAGGYASNQLNRDTLLARFIINAASHVPFDFDGDGKSDISVYRPNEGNWYLLNSTSGFTVTHWGNSTDKIVPGDYNGDGKTDWAVFRPSEGNWYILQGVNPGFAQIINFGLNGDMPFTADVNGDGIDEIIVFRPSTGVWYYRQNGLAMEAQFGLNGDIPVASDFDGDGKADLAVFRPSNGTWYILQSSNGQAKTVRFGLAEDKPLIGDFDGDGKTDIAVWRPSTGVWYRINSSDNQIFIYQFGLSGDIPTVGDFDGDGKSDITVFRPSNGIWYRLNSGNGQFDFTQFGLSGDKPIPAYHLP